MLKLNKMKNKNKQRGFVRFIIILIVALVIAQLLGYGPIEFITKIIIPGLIIAWKIILVIVNLIVEAVRQAYTFIINIPANDLMKDLKN